MPRADARAERARTEGGRDVPRRRDQGGGRSPAGRRPGARSGSEKTVFKAATFAEQLRESWRAMGKTAAPKATFEEFWEGALRRGGYWADVPGAEARAPRRLQGGRAGAGPRRQRVRSRAPGDPVVPLRRRARRQQGVAPRDAGPDDPGGVRELGRDLRGDGARARREAGRHPEGSSRPTARSRPRPMSRRPWRRARWQSRPASGTPSTVASRGCGPEPLRAPPGRAGGGLGWSAVARRASQAPEDRKAREARLARRV
jgi:hypothetical protein